MNSLAKLTDIFKACTKFLVSEKIALLFIFTHLFVAVILGRFYILAPDEIGYLNTFNNLYGGRFEYPQTVSGWITSPTYLLRIIFLPAEILKIVGISDILSLRLCTIMYSLFAFRLMQLEIRRSNSSKKIEWLFLFFFLIPTVLLWSSIGLRESFIYLSLALILCGLRKSEKHQSNVSLLMMFIGSFLLLCTKFYLWGCIALATLLIFFLLIIKKNYYPGLRSLFNLGGSLIALPMLIFFSTAPSHAVNFVKDAVSINRVQNAADRSGDSISSVTQSEQDGIEVQFSGNSTAIAIEEYLSTSTNSLLFKLLAVTGLSEKLSETTNSFVSNQENSNTKLIDSNPYALDTPSVTDPKSLFISVSNFMLGPYPIFNDYGFIMASLSWESIIWWFLFSLVLYTLWLQIRSTMNFDLCQRISLCFVLIFILLSALIEVNVGTALRHRSVLLIPLLSILLPVEKNKIIQK